MEPYREPVKKMGAAQFLAIILIGFALGMAPGAFKIRKLQSDLDVTISERSKELTDLRATVATLNAKTKDCNSVLLGDGTKTLLMDVNHPYGKYVPPATILPKGYVPGTVWIINRKVTPRTMDGTLNGAYAYEHPDGSIEGWFSGAGSRDQVSGNR
jgi:hypothetical protein